MAPTGPVGKQNLNRCSNQDNFYIHLTDCSIYGQSNTNDFWFVIYVMIQGMFIAQEALAGVGQSLIKCDS